MKILVTGGTGFIGSHLTKQLRESYSGIHNQVYTVSRTRLKGGSPQNGYFFHTPIGHDNMGYCQRDLMHITADLSDRESACKVMKTFNPDMVFHLAANPLTKMGDDPFKIMHDNMMSTQYICEYAKQDCRVVFASSIVVYGTTNGTKPSESSDIQPTSLYGVSKHAAEGIVNVYTQLGRIRGVNLRLCATVGAGVTHGILYDFVRKLQSDSPDFELLGDMPGSNKPYLYIDDAVSAFMSMCDPSFSGVYNICPDDNITVHFIANLAKTVTGISKPNKWLGSAANWKGDNPELMACNNKAKNNFWQPKFNNSGDAVTQAIRDIMEQQ